MILAQTIRAILVTIIDNDEVKSGCNEDKQDQLTNWEKENHEDYTTRSPPKKPNNANPIRGFNHEIRTKTQNWLWRIELTSTDLWAIKLDPQNDGRRRHRENWDGGRNIKKGTIWVPKRECRIKDNPFPTVTNQIKPE